MEAEKDVFYDFPFLVDDGVGSQVEESKTMITGRSLKFQTNLTLKNRSNKKQHAKFVPNNDLKQKKIQSNNDPKEWSKKNMVKPQTTAPHQVRG